MSYLHNKRRGGAANKPRPVRVCVAYDATKGNLKCGRAVDPGLNGNRCEDHR